VGFGIGGAVLAAGATALTAAAGWRWVWWLAGALALVVSVPLLRGLAGDMAPPPRTAPGVTDSPDWRRRDLLRNPTFLAILTVVLVPAFVVTAVFLHQSSLAEVRGWAPWQVAVAFMVFAAFQALATMAAGRLVDLFGSPAVMRLVLVPLAGGLLALGLLEGAAGLYLLFAGLGATAGGNAVVAGAVWAELFGTRHLGRVRGVYAALMVLSSAASPPLLGWALATGVPLAALCLVTAAYAMIMPQLAYRALKVRRGESRNGGGVT
jgi:MFS family permease